MGLKPSSSIVLKLITICFYFLVVPQILFSLIIMRAEYVSNFKNFIITLNHAAQEQIEIFQKTLENQFAGLRLVHYLINEKIPQGAVSQDELKNFLVELGGVQLMVADEVQGRWQMKLYVGQPIDQQILDELLQSKALFYDTKALRSIRKGNRVDLYLAHIQEYLDRPGRSVMIVKIDPETFLEDNFYFQDWQQTSAALVYDDEIIASTRQEHIGQEVFLHTENVAAVHGVHLIESDRFVGAYHLFFEGETFFSIIKEIPGTDLTLVVDSSSLFLEKAWIRFAIYAAAFLAGLVIFGLGIVIFFSKRLSRPLKRMIEVMEAVADGDLNARYQQTAFGFEINSIGAHFNKMCESLKKLMEDVKNITVKKEVLENELQMGQLVQRTLQNDRDIASETLKITTYFQAARHVGGDFFDILPLEKEGKKYLLITIADTCGKGIFACLYALILKSFLKAGFYDTPSFEHAIIHANRLFYEDTQSQNAFVTAFFCWIDLETYQMHYVSCGHLPMLIASQGQVMELNTAGIALGVLKEINLEVKHLQLEPGMVAMIHSDGLNEMVNIDDQPLGMERLKEVLVSSGSDIDQIEKELLKLMNSWKENMPLFDDETFILFKRPDV